MPFDVKAFKKAKFEPRVAYVPVPDLKDFFAADEKPLWKVRSLSGHEMGLINEAADRNKNIGAVIEGIISSIAKDKVDAIKSSLGLTDDTPAEIVRRIEMLSRASLNPEIDSETAVKFCKNFPVEFYEITTAILKITGKGSEVKRKASNLFADIDVKNSLSLCFDKKTYLYQIRPDIMPYDYLSDMEMELWEMFYAEMKEKSKTT